MGKNAGLKATLLLTSTDQMVATSLIIPIMGYIAQAFPNAGASIMLLMTLPNLCMVPAILITGKLCDYVSKKILLVIATLIFTIGGIAGGVYDNFTFMLVTRAFMGIGAGMLFSLPQAFIAQLFSGQERVTMMGWSAAVGSIFSVIFNMISGTLGVINWHYCFYAFAVYFLLVMFQIAKVPNLPPEKKDETLQRDTKDDKLGFRIVFFSIAIFCMFTLLCFLTVDISLFVIGENLGTSVQAGIASSILTLTSFAMASLFAFWFKIFKRYLPVVSALAMVVGYFVLSHAYSMSTIYIGAVIIGITSGSFGPYFMTRASIVVPKSKQTLAIAIISTCMFVGMFATTYYGMFLASIFGSSYRNIFFGVSISALILAIAILIYIPLTQRFEAENPQNMTAEEVK
ncbi:MAG: Arabinose efflux permease [Oscillospiraceae bacterium]|nr:Arabinose efflux permease [Oscillospiraceae bacterium]